MKKIILIICMGLMMTSIQAGKLTEKDTHTIKLHASLHQKKSDIKTNVDINTADAKTLTTLKGVGAKKAEQIINYREAHGKFKSLSDLAEVKGIGEKGLARMIKNNPDQIVINP